MDPITLRNRLMDLKGNDVDRLIGCLGYDVEHDPAIAAAVERYFEAIDRNHAIQKARESKPATA